MVSEQDRTDTLIYFSQGDPFHIYKQNTVMLSMGADYKNRLLHGIEE